LRIAPKPNRIIPEGRSPSAVGSTSRKYPRPGAGARFPPPSSGTRYRSEIRSGEGTSTRYRGEYHSLPPRTAENR